jgi:hypothetical protein
VSAFYGIVIWMYHDDHNPPHFHATYGEHAAVVEIATLRPLRGALPARAWRLVEEWASLHAEELAHGWDLARAGQPILSIDPLP